MKVSIIGLGWFGLPLAKLLMSEHEVFGTTTSIEKLTDLKNFPITSELCAYPQTPSKNLLESDVIILNIPPFDEELTWFKSWDWQNKWIIFISSTSALASPDNKLKVQEEWVQKSFNDWTILRFGGLYGDKRHPGKSLSGKKNLAGRNWPVNLLHLEDAVLVTKTIIDRKVKNKTFEVVGDEHPTREEYYSEWCRKHGLPIPEFEPNDVSTKPVIANTEIKKYYGNFRSLKNS